MHRTIVVAILIVAASIGAAASDPQAALTNERIFESIRAREGSTVCEIGAGDGKATLAAAKAVGSSGRVYANELGESKLTQLREAVERSGFSHITVIAAEPTRTNFPDAGCDALFMRDVYHHFTEPASMNRAILTALKPGGRAAIVDFTPPPDREAPSPADRGKDGTHGISPDTMIEELTEAGFEIVRSELPEQRWFMVIVARPRTRN